MDKIELVVGLGNPGKEYSQTRHNAGAWWIETLVNNYHETLNNESKFLGKIANIKIDNHTIKAFIPSTFMNESGKAIAYISKFYKISPKKILVVHDDLDLPAGKIKFKLGGGHAGHNGLRDIISAIDSNDFARLRIGVGHPGSKHLVSNYVLKAPSKDDKDKIMHAIHVSIDMHKDILNANWNKVMNELHNLELD